VLAGKGHNGDDARFAMEYMSGRHVRLMRVLDPEMAATEITPLLKARPALLIDGLFGVGLNRPLSRNLIRFIQQINEAHTPILAVDIPSGLNADTGLPLEDAIRATHTLTLGAIKEGLLKSNAWPFVGRLEVAADIGLLPYPFTTEISWIVPEDFAEFP